MDPVEHFTTPKGYAMAYRWVTPETKPPEAKPPLVFLHGSGLGASGWLNFKDNATFLAAQGYRCLLPDLIGYGDSDKPEQEQYTTDFFLEALEALLKHLNIEVSIPVGNSLGGAIALGWALAHPKKVAKLVLMAPGGLHDVMTYMGMPGIQKLGRIFMAPRPLEKEQMLELLEALCHDPSNVADEVVMARLAIANQQPKSVLMTMKVPNYSSRLDEIACPTLAFWGKEDRFCPIKGADVLEKGMPSVQVHRVEKCGHWVMTECPDLFNQKTLAFLEQA